MSSDLHLTYAAIRARVRQRLAAHHADVQEELIADTCLAIAAFAHEQEALIEAIWPDAKERQEAAALWRDEITAIRQLGACYYQQALQRGAPVPLAEQAVNLALWQDFFQLPHDRPEAQA